MPLREAVTRTQRLEWMRSNTHFQRLFALDEPLEDLVYYMTESLDGENVGYVSLSLLVAFFFSSPSFVDHELSFGWSSLLLYGFVLFSLILYMCSVPNFADFDSFAAIYISWECAAILRGTVTIAN